MTVEKDLYSTFASFPSSDHVKDVCKLGAGKATCRYLSMGPNGFRCEKASSLRGYLDKRVEEGSMGAIGDNCEGTLGFVRDNQALLIGKKTVYEESHPNFYKEAEFKSLKVADGETKLRTTKEGHLDIAEDYTQIDIYPHGITFSGRGLGSFLGTLQIRFEKP